MPLYSKLSIDGVVGDIYDEAAFHSVDFPEALSEALLTPTIKNVILNLVYPVGRCIITSNPANPSTYIGGTWQKIEGKFIIGASAAYPVGTTGGYTDAVIPEHCHDGSTISINSGGAHTHPVSGTAAANGAHKHNVGSGRSMVTHNNASQYTISEKSANLPGSDYHIPVIKKGDNWYGEPNTNTQAAHAHSVSGTAASAGSHTHTGSVTVKSTGTSVTGRNIPPYFALYIWLRTA